MNHKAIVTSGQIFLLLFINRISSSIIYSNVLIQQNIWDNFIPLLIYFLFNFLFLLPMIFLHKNLFYIHHHSLMKFLSYSYGIYFIFDIIHNLLYFSDFILELSGTAINGKIIIFFIILAALYGAFRGIEAIARFSVVPFLAIILSSVMIFTFIMPSYSADNLLPIAYINQNSIFDHSVRIFSATNEIAALFILSPLIKNHFQKSALLWNIFMYLFFSALILLISGSLGEYLRHLSFKTYHIIDGAAVLQRFNPFFIGVCISAFFCSMTMKLFLINQCVKYISNHQKIRNTLIISCSAFVFTIFLILYHKIPDFIPIRFILNMIFSFIIPITILIFTLFKNQKINKKIVSLILTITLSVSILSGCSFNNQLNQRIIIQGIGIDKIQENYRLSLIILDTDSKEENSSKIIYAQGNTIEQALSSLENRTGKKILLNQCLFLMLNQNSLKNSSDLLSYFLKNNDIIKTVNITSSEQSAEMIFNQAVVKLGYHPEDINIISDSNAVEQPSVHFSLFDYTVDINDHFHDMLLPNIIIDENLKSLKIKGSRLLSQRNQTNFLLDESQTLGALIINQKAINYQLTMDHQTYSIKDLSVKIIPELHAENLILNFKINILLNQNFNQEIYHYFYDSIHSALTETVTKNGCDIFSIHKYFRLKYPAYYKNITDWSSILKKAEIKIDLFI